SGLFPVRAGLTLCRPSQDGARACREGQGSSMNSDNVGALDLRQSAGIGSGADRASAPRQPASESEVIPMNLLTRGLERRFAAVGSQQDVADPLVIAKFFNPAGAGTWLATE